MMVGGGGGGGAGGDGRAGGGGGGGDGRGGDGSGDYLKHGGSFKLLLLYLLLASNTVAGEVVVNENLQIQGTYNEPSGWQCLKLISEDALVVLRMDVNSKLGRRSLYTAGNASVDARGFKTNKWYNVSYAATTVNNKLGLVVMVDGTQIVHFNLDGNGDNSTDFTFHQVTLMIKGKAEVDDCPASHHQPHHCFTREVVDNANLRIQGTYSDPSGWQCMKLISKDALVVLRMDVNSKLGRRSLYTAGNTSVDARGFETNKWYNISYATTTVNNKLGLEVMVDGTQVVHFNQDGNGDNSTDYTFHQVALMIKGKAEVGDCPLSRDQCPPGACDCAVSVILALLLMMMLMMMTFVGLLYYFKQRHNRIYTPRNP